MTSDNKKSNNKICTWNHVNINYQVHEKGPNGRLGGQRDAEKDKFGIYCKVIFINLCAVIAVNTCKTTWSFLVKACQD